LAGIADQREERHATGDAEEAGAEEDDGVFEQAPSGIGSTW
jgi:hypothetical protein